jgi:RNA polymerase sigma-70 factor, ECF subfamily
LQRDRQLLESALLTVRWQQGDQAAFAGIVELWERSLFYYLRRLTSSEEDAWELLQETWLKVFRSLRYLRDPHTLPAFLYRTARNAAISRLRRPEFYQLDRDDIEAPDERYAESTNDCENATDVHFALGHLPLLQREVLTLFYLKDLSLSEVSVLLGVPLGTVKSRLHKARQSLRTILLKGDKHDEPQRGISPAASGRTGDISITSGDIPKQT